MSTLEDKLAFVHIKSHKRQVLQRVTIYVFFIMMFIPLGYGVYKLLMQWDYNNLKHYIEYDIMQGYDKLYDYTLSIQDDGIKDIEDLPSWEKKEKSIGSLLLSGPSWKYDAFKTKMPRYSEPSNTPFSITSIEKNLDGGYDIKTYNAEGIVYKTQAPIFEVLKEQEKPKKVYNDAFEYLINKEFNEYKLSKGSSCGIKSLCTPLGYTANKKGYDETHITSKFHSVDRQRKTKDLISGYPQGDYGYNGRGNVYNDKNITYYSYSERYLQIQEHPYNQLGKIMTICIGVGMALCFLCLFICISHIRKRLRLSGVIWMEASKSNAIIFQYPVLGKPRIRFISENDDKEYSYTTSKDGSRILLSNGEIYTLCITQLKDNIELKRGETISTYYDLNRMKS